MWVPLDDEVHFVPLPPPTQEEVEWLVAVVRWRRAERSWSGLKVSDDWRGTWERAAAHVRQGPRCRPGGPMPRMTQA